MNPLNLKYKQMIENKLCELYKINTSDKKKPDMDNSAKRDSKLKKENESPEVEKTGFLPKFAQNEYFNLFEKCVNDLFLNVDENVELNLILSKLVKKPPKNSTQKFQEKLESSFKNSLKKNISQRNSIKKFMNVLLADIVSSLAKKEVFSKGRNHAGQKYKWYFVRWGKDPQGKDEGNWKGIGPSAQKKQPG